LRLPASTASPGPLRHRARFPGQQGFVRGAGAGLDDRISGHALPGGDAHPVADRQRIDRDARHGAILCQPFDVVGQRLRGLFNRRRRAMPRAQFQIPRAQQEGHEHRDRVEEDLVSERAARVQRRAAAGHEGHAQSERHRHVHAQAPSAQLTQRRPEERSRGKQHHRQRQHPLAPAQQRGLVGRQFAGRGHVGRPRQHHHLHHQEARDEQVPERLAMLAPAQVAGRARDIRYDVVARRREHLPQLVERHEVRIPVQHQRLGRRMDLGPTHAALRVQPGLDQSRAGRAVHARQAETTARQRCVGSGAIGASGVGARGAGGHRGG
jgi:hypothetical protein